MIPTEEQSAILSAVRTTKSNLMIVARAGCGKTSTLELIDRTLGSSPALLICFNKSIAEEATKRMRSATSVRTMNSIGHKIWADYQRRKLKLSPTKIRDIFKSIVDDEPRAERNELWKLYNSVIDGVNMARSLGYIPTSHAKSNRRLIDYSDLITHLDETPVPEARGLIDRILNLSIAAAYDGLIDFNDQVYMPALFGGLYPSFPIVMIDEYQDLSPVNRALVNKLCRNSRQIGVGDPAQAIYGFRGADSDAISKAVTQFNMQVMPLTLSFRCPSNITNNVHWHVPDIRSTKEGGEVETKSDFDILPGSAVICRYNSALIALAMKLLRSGQKVDVGGVDILARVIRQLSKFGDESLPRPALISAIVEWQAERESLDSKSATDLAETMKVFAAHGANLGQAIAYAKHIAEAKGEIRFFSGHKSKGLEFAHVYHLDSGRIRRGEEQESNIAYVIDTRAQERLTYIGELNAD